ncbi:hypothetical protein HanRHA438_Chr15g0729091 [Helianthus annuus]|nr:hypothetical protein HanHA89_Chr15g0634411 [Helianthus annuus]KAJ0650402.1 hypothetical protein HanLR1_Chr15g0595331 [Helianthus annuus]KAJ0654166.1 hypothetical protein HanOQP8_Chr15g0591861 [Helianthus annuus]KAJ0846807.1 hypothetical protein HanRHA438_Chr15g0729091 [Helianthus annuus]
MINSFLLFFPKKPRVRLESEDGMSPNVGIPSPEGHVYVFILVVNSQDPSIESLLCRSGVNFMFCYYLVFTRVCNCTACLICYKGFE